MTDYVVLEFSRPLYDIAGEPTDQRRGWFPSSDVEGIVAALEHGAVEVGQTNDPAEMERLLDERGDVRPAAGAQQDRG